MDIQQFEGRKQDHVRLALDAKNQATALSGLSSIHLNHDALPELDLEEVRLDSSCLGQATRTPFFVAAITAGHSESAAINRTLGKVCSDRGWALGLGSQRRDLDTNVPESSSYSPDDWGRFRSEFPDLMVFANIGISQLSTISTKKLDELIQKLRPAGLVVHTNPLQEAIQEEGTPHFKGALQRLETLCKTSPIPVILKETGCGFSCTTLEKLRGVALSALDISGLGGTHWARIEGARAEPTSIKASAARTFAAWGEPTADSVLSAREILSNKTEIWGSGGVRSGLDAAKLIALGADRIGYAQPALAVALAGSAELNRWMEQQEYELRVALFCTGCKTPSELKNKENAWRRSAT
ncbi:MAG TPA: type 2 isopentenyl-diphosphate Delta-isomerase [Bdellovibrionota bacterium]|nr:type 2 isopentenyl-diphosphate Delta-isomerase [Bdellovibrionota bacterium]